MKKFIQTVITTIILIIGMSLMNTVFSQKTIKATGTGQTTGHVATLSVTNSTGSPLKINPQICFIPSDGKYQPYIVVIPGHTFPPGTTTLPLDGYCADVHSPPVPGGNDMPPVEEWIPVGNPSTTL